MNTKSILLGMLIGILFTTLCSLLLLIFYFKVFDKEDIKVQEENKVEEENEAFLDFKGKYITAKYPQGWTFKEYVDGEGSSLLEDSDTTLKGLSAFEIFNKNNTSVFKVTAVDGIGGTNYCELYYAFEDYNKEHYNDIKEENKKYWQNDVKLKSLSKEEYSEFTILDTRFRRIGRDLVKDVLPGNEYFETSCGFSSNIMFYDMKSKLGLDFPYMISIYDNAEENDLKIVDRILDSLDSVK